MSVWLRVLVAGAVMAAGGGWYFRSQAHVAKASGKADPPAVVGTREDAPAVIDGRSVAGREAMRARVMANVGAMSGDANWYEGLPQIDAAYYRTRLRDVFWPEVRACTAQARARHSNVRGVVGVEYTIVGDAAVGGFVEAARIDRDASTVHDSSLDACIQQSMLAMTFAAPPATGAITATYRFNVDE